MNICVIWHNKQYIIENNMSDCNLGLVEYKRVLLFYSAFVRCQLLTTTDHQTDWLTCGLCVSQLHQSCCQPQQSTLSIRRRPISLVEIHRACDILKHIIGPERAGEIDRGALFIVLAQAYIKLYTPLDALTSHMIIMVATKIDICRIYEG